MFKKIDKTAAIQVKIFDDNFDTAQTEFEKVNSNIYNKLVDKEILKGDSEGKLNLTEEMVRLFVINDRVGVYGE